MAKIGWVAVALSAACATGEPLDSVSSGGSGPGGGAQGGSSATVESCDVGTPCGALCVDLQTDPSNCGSCGRSCVLPNGEAACAAGECALAACDPGFADCDDDVETGCETEDACQPGAACATACGSTGALSCDDPCAPSCATPVEACNAVDDDCDGACDQGALAGCRVGVHRAYNGANGHLFTTDLAEAQAWGLEAQNFFYLYADAAADLRPFFRCAKPSGAVFFSESNDCELTGPPVSTLGFIAPQPAAGAQPTCGAIPLYRIRLDANGWHFYTTSLAERDAALAAGWADEGLPGYVFAAP